AERALQDIPSSVKPSTPDEATIAPTRRPPARTPAPEAGPMQPAAPEGNGELPAPRENERPATTPPATAPPANRGGGFPGVEVPPPGTIFPTQPTLPGNGFGPAESEIPNPPG